MNVKLKWKEQSLFIMASSNKILFGIHNQESENDMYKENCRFLLKETEEDSDKWTGICVHDQKN